MAQRAALAMAMACRPALLIADEPTSGLDATLQQQVLDLLTSQIQEQKSSMLLITHDMSVVGSTCEQVAVMYGGRIMEVGPTELVLRHPINPYTQKLVDAFSRSKDGKMTSIPGTVGPPISESKGCPFANVVTKQIKTAEHISRSCCINKIEWLPALKHDLAPNRLCRLPSSSS